MTVCFSAEASLLSSAALTVVGVATLRQVQQPNERALAAFPLIFAFHQLIEGVLWLAHDHNGPAWLISLLAHAFPLIAYVVWPTLVPYAIYRMEPHALRRKLLLTCRVIGVAVSLFFLVYITEGPVTAKFVNQSIHYDFYFSFWVLSQWLYGYAIIMATFFSSHKIINAFGLGLVITYNIAKQFYLASYPSVFCFFAALLSLILFLQIRYGDTLLRQPARSPGWVQR